MAKADPNSVQGRFEVAQALQSKGRLSEARAILQALLLRAPKVAQIHFQLGQIAAVDGQTDQAATHYANAATLAPSEPAIPRAEVALHTAAGNADATLAAHDRLIELMPDQVKPRADKALYLQQIGQFDAARAEFRRALKRAPWDGEIYRLMVAGEKIAPNAPVIADMQKALRHPRCTGRARIHMNFALAKAMEDAGRHERVFHYLRPANSETRAMHPYDPQSWDAEVDGWLRLFDGMEFDAPSEPASDSPIFVTGLPRSGTTLIEQILARHSEVSAGEEMNLLRRMAYARLRYPGAQPLPITNLSRSDIRALGDSYVSAAQKRLGTQARFTDKSIQSYLMTGLIRQALPGARVIVVRRDPRDVALSIYKNVFAEGTHRYAYDLNDLAHYCKAFLRVLDYWRDRLPGGFEEVHYEDLVADPEPQIRALIAAAGLPWEDGCLETGGVSGRVRTLSIYQVRQPIYASSRRAWERHADEMAPFITAMGDRLS
ncbi:MAG: sulfotransferase [Celeribacter sp.]|jgi:tetratricopeptide (TPR) repeat protein